MAPFLMLLAGLISSLVAALFSRYRISQNRIDNVLLEGLYVSVLVCGGLTWGIMQTLPITLPTDLVWGISPHFHPFLAYLTGLAGAVLFGFGSEILTSHNYPSARHVASQAEYGSAVTVLNGMALGKKSQGLFLLGLLAVMSASFYAAGLYGIAMAAMGMVSVACTILAVTFFSPLATSLVKLARLAEFDDSRIKRLLKLDKIGNTTAALDHGFAAGVSVLSAFGLFFVLLLMSRVNLASLFSLELPVLVGLLVGITLPELFSGYLISGLIATIRKMVSEIGRQFSDIPYLREGKAKPDMVKASDMAARFSMDSLIVSGIVMVLTPIAAGYILGTSFLIGIILGALLMGFGTGFSMANAGGVLHSAKHFILSGHYGGKKSPTYQNAVHADSVGDAFQDLLSPCMTVLMRGVVILALYLMIILNITH
jgi:K(+)-stimulated pyrophosphate-energized sodium pump